MISFTPKSQVQSMDLWLWYNNSKQTTCTGSNLIKNPKTPLGNFFIREGKEIIDS